MSFGRTSLLKILKKSDGIALFVAILVMAIVMLFIGGSLLFSRIDSKITSNFKLGTQSLEVANAGLLHGLTLIGDGYDFDSHLTCGTPPCNVLSSTTFPPGSDFAYTVTLENDPADINSDGSATDDTNYVVVLLSTSSGPNDTKREIQAYVNRSLVSFSPPGALYIPASTATFNFPTGKGEFTGFITGDDTSYTDSDSDGWADSTGTGTASSITGVAPINDTVGDSFKSAMGTTRYNLVQGAGYSADPLTPSVFTTSDVIDVNQIALNFYNNVAPENLLVNGLSKSDCNSGNPCIFGTDASPQITYIREGSKFINPDGDVTGSGVLVTEGKTHFRGDFEFHGMVISVKLGLTGGTDPGTVNADYFSMRDTSRIFGAVLLGPKDSPLGFEMKDNTKIYYSKDAIEMAQNLCGSCFPQPPKILSLLSQ
jgi:hypothetical protein